jgi:SAM-dependent methyltransferase
MNADHYFEVNRQSWNNRVDTHLESAFYDVQGFLNGNSSLKEIELGLLGNIEGKTILHLQCHFGQDTISLSRLGAKAMGIDLSDEAIKAARQLALDADTDTEFICCNIYDLPEHLIRQFDIVFTSYGTIGWLPDLDKWASIISQFLKPGGKFIMAEFHPVVWMFDDNFEKVAYNYFNNGPIVETENGTYANKEAAITQQYVMWNHSTAEVLTALLINGLEINAFNEFDYSPYNCFSHTAEPEPGMYRIKHMDNKIPMVFSLLASKKA